MIRLVALACGLLCGGGLILSGMADPARVQAFLRPGPGWDPSFGLAILAAIAVAFMGIRLHRRLGHALLPGPSAPAEAEAVDIRLVAGSLIFGLGWGLSGYSPGTALTAVGQFLGDGALFAASALVGMLLHDLTTARGRAAMRSLRSRG
ncbi:MAG: YeeE/YedE family protein [Tabrizicola sp.]|jgi:hypothetical protein|nr:YeeE/YedE family protein [Tabrizicola sp.]